MNERTQNRFGLDQREITERCVEGSRWFRKFLFTGIGATRVSAEYSLIHKMLYGNDQDGDYDHLSPWLNGIRAETLLTYHAFDRDTAIPTKPKPEMNMVLFNELLVVLGELNRASVPIARNPDNLRRVLLKASQLGNQLGARREFSTLYAGVCAIRKGFSINYPGETKETLLRPMDGRDNPYSIN